MLKAAIRADWRLLVFGMLMTFWSSPGQTYLISLFGGDIRATFDLSHGEFGSIYSAGTLLSAAVLMWTGKLVDRMPLLRLSIIVISLLAVGCVWMSVSVSPWMLVIGIFLLRQTGQGLMTLISATAMVRYFDQIKGKASAISHLGFSIAEAMLPAITILCIALFGWRQTWRFAALALILLLPFIWLLLRDHRDRHKRYLRNLELEESGQRTARARRQWTRSEVLRDTRFYLYLPAMLCPSFFFTGFFFHQVYMVEYKGWDLTHWGGLFVVYAASAFCTTLASGPLVDRLGAIRNMPWFCVPLGFALLVLSSSDHILIAPAFMVLTGITTGWNPTVVGPFWADMYGSRHLASIKSMGSALMVMSTALSPFVLGWLFDNGYALDTVARYSVVIIICCALLAHFALTSSRQAQDAPAV